MMVEVMLFASLVLFGLILVFSAAIGQRVEQKDGPGVAAALAIAFGLLFVAMILLFTERYQFGRLS